MVPSMGTMERLYSPKINNVAVVFNFNTIFYVRSRSEEISPCRSSYVFSAQNIHNPQNRAVFIAPIGAPFTLFISKLEHLLLFRLWGDP